MGEITLQQLAGLTLGSAWGQVLLWVAVVGSVAYDKRDALKALPAKFKAWRASRRTAPQTVADVGCESRRLTLVGIRHKASELTDATKRNDALALCDQMDVLAKELWPEAA